MALCVDMRKLEEEDGHGSVAMKRDSGSLCSSRYNLHKIMITVLFYSNHMVIDLARYIFNSMS